MTFFILLVIIIALVALVTRNGSQPESNEGPDPQKPITDEEIDSFVNNLKFEVRVLTDDDLRVQAKEDGRSSPQLLRDLKNPEHRVNSRAADTLIYREESSVAVLPDLFALTTSKDRDLRVRAFRVIEGVAGEVGDEALYHGCGRLASLGYPDLPVTPSREAFGLDPARGTYDSRGADYWISLLSHRSVEVRLIAIRALEKLKGHAQEAIPLLLDITRKKNRDLKFAACKAIFAIARASGEHESLRIAQQTFDRMR